uniref:Palmitoyl-protein thioesterase ABHD10, mitochondrial n=1 Tax=uncultured Alphaproteobacteria bacterium TaxID=91750 RepID=A0A6G8F2Z9_9PROT|nr:alpha/beta hydrolase [uncultured Alphaproteobacteria bacterium]
MPKYTFKSQFATDFEYIAPKNNKPTVLYLHGFCSNAWGRKPETVKEFCLQSGFGFVRFDFAGHGSSFADFEKTDFEVWKSQVFEAVDTIVDGDCIVVGSSMGGWLAMYAAMRYPEKVKGMIGLAAAPNFVRRFEKQVTPEQRHELETTGKFVISNNDFAYTITSRFVETAMASCFPEDGTSWDIRCPVHLIQGMKDASVPWHEVLKYAERIVSDKVEVKLLKDSNHRLNDDAAISELRCSLANIVNI